MTSAFRGSALEKGKRSPSGDEAFAALETVVEEHSSAVVLAKLDSFVDPLRSDARFDAVLQRVGLG